MCGHVDEEGTNFDSSTLIERHLLLVLRVKLFCGQSVCSPIILLPKSCNHFTDN